MKHSELFQLRLDPQTRGNLEKLSQATGKSQAEILRQLIDQAATGQQPQRQPFMSQAVTK